MNNCACFLSSAEIHTLIWQWIAFDSLYFEVGSPFPAVLIVPSDCEFSSSWLTRGQSIKLKDSSFILLQLFPLFNVGLATPEELKCRSEQHKCDFHLFSGCSKKEVMQRRGKWFWQKVECLEMGPTDPERIQNHGKKTNRTQPGRSPLGFCLQLPCAFWS